MDSFVITVAPFVTGFWAHWVVLGFGLMAVVFLSLLIQSDKTDPRRDDYGMGLGLSSFVFVLVGAFSLIGYFEALDETRFDHLQAAVVALGYDEAHSVRANAESRNPSHYTLVRDGEATLYMVDRDGDTFRFHQIAE